MEQLGYFIYMISNNINGKIYIGKTIDPDKRWRRHRNRAASNDKRYCYYIHRALNKYGWRNFTFEVIEQHQNKKDQNEAEKFWIAYYKFIGAQVYNLTNGGEGCDGRVVSEETRRKISIAHLGMKHSNETRKLISENGKRRFQDLDQYNKMLIQNKKIAKTKGSEKTNFTKLNWNIINDIRAKYKSNNFSIPELAKIYNITRQNTRYIVKYITWKIQEKNEKIV